MVVAIDLETYASSGTVLATMLILVLVILEDWCLSFYAKFHDTLAYLFDGLLCIPCIM